ncbi:MAG: hypothetical protein N2508_12535 [Anaerolineae bacterium]|nr:hypothetical protein [Anaerolineae bacterium]
MPRVEGSPSTTEITWEELLRALEEHPEWLARVRQVVLTRDLLTLPETIRELVASHRQAEVRLSRLEVAVQELQEAQRQTTLQIQELREAQRQTTLQIQELREAQQQTNLQIQELREAQRQTTFQIQAIWEAIQRNTAQLKDLIEVAQMLVEGQRRLDGTVGEIKGTLLEIKYREQPYAYFGHLLRSIQAISLRTIENELESHLTSEELRDVFRLDLLLRGRLRDAPERPEVWLAIEVSSVVDKGDVERAGRRAALLRKAGFRAIPVAAGLSVNEEAQREAGWDRVVVVKDGQVFFWEETVQHYLEEH